MKMLIGISLCLLVGCVTTDEQIMHMDNEQLCAAAQHEPLNARIVNFIDARGLQDCHPVQISCSRAGFQRDTPAYQTCMQGMFQQMQLEQAQQAAAAQAILSATQNYFQQRQQAAERAAERAAAQRPVTTNCYANGEYINCTSQ
jgi:hypothetical protein